MSYQTVQRFLLPVGRVGLLLEGLFDLLGLCVKADAATDLTAFGVFGLESSFAALLATLFEVTSDLRAIVLTPLSYGLIDKE